MKMAATRRPVTIALTTPAVSAIVVHCESLKVPPTLSNLEVVVSDVELSNSEITSVVAQQTVNGSTLSEVVDSAM